MNDCFSVKGFDDSNSLVGPRESSLRASVFGLPGEEIFLDPDHPHVFEPGHHDMGEEVVTEIGRTCRQNQFDPLGAVGLDSREDFAAVLVTASGHYQGGCASLEVLQQAEDLRLVVAVVLARAAAEDEFDVPKDLDVLDWVGGVGSEASGDFGNEHGSSLGQ
jgi:hypothetical protein